jgi:hypothetical protein
MCPGTEYLRLSVDASRFNAGTVLLRGPPTGFPSLCGGTHVFSFGVA